MQRRYEILLEMGVEFNLGVEVGKDITFNEIYQAHDVVFLAIGTYHKIPAALPGEGLSGVYQALDYLTNNNCHQLNLIVDEDHHNLCFDRVIVLGGGDTAMDCSRTAIRQQASSVYCAYRRNEQAMPGSQREVYKAKEEGVKFLWHYQPVEIMGKEKVEGVKFVKTEMIEQPGGSKPQLTVVEGSEVIIPAEKVVIAFGFKPDHIPWLQDYSVELDQYGRIKTANTGARAFQTSQSKIFAGGDIKRGADLVVTAIFEGRSAAKSIINYLNDQACLVTDEG